MIDKLPSFSGFNCDGFNNLLCMNALLLGLFVLTTLVIDAMLKGFEHSLIMIFNEYAKPFNIAPIKYFSEIDILSIIVVND